MPGKGPRRSRKRSQPQPQVDGGMDILSQRLYRLALAEQKVQELQDWDRIADALREVYGVPSE